MKIFVPSFVLNSTVCSLSKVKLYLASGGWYLAAIVLMELAFCMTKAGDTWKDWHFYLAWLCFWLAVDLCERGKNVFRKSSE